MPDSPEKEVEKARALASQFNNVVMRQLENGTVDPISFMEGLDFAELEGLGSIADTPAKEQEFALELMEKWARQIKARGLKEHFRPSIPEEMFSQDMRPVFRVAAPTFWELYLKEPS